MGFLRLCVPAFLLFASAAIANDAVDRYPMPSDVIYGQRLSGEISALGTSYKIHADEEGFAFIPFLGSRAPKSFPVRFAAVSVTIDGVEHALPSGAEVRRQGRVVSIDRGAVEARYTLSPASVEQAFVVRSPGRGEVRLSLQITTELELDTSGPALRFAGELGEVRYGAATAIAADGRTSHVTTVPTNAGLDLVVDAAFVASCDGELLIDPVLSGGTVTSPTAPWVTVESDVGADADVGYGVAIERAFSATR